MERNPKEDKLREGNRKNYGPGDAEEGEEESPSRDSEIRGRGLGRKLGRRKRRVAGDEEGVRRLAIGRPKIATAAVTY